MISVVINVYNGENSIMKCINSLLAQTYTDFELLIIDDGSTDRTKQITDEISKQFDCVRVFHTENKGLSESRSYALSHIQGDYLIFVDCDDWVEVDYLEKLLIAITTDNADIAICDYYEEYEGKTKYIEIPEGNKIVDYTRNLIH